MPGPGTRQAFEPGALILSSELLFLGRIRAQQCVILPVMGNASARRDRHHTRAVYETPPGDLFAQSRGRRPLLQPAATNNGHRRQPSRGAWSNRSRICPGGPSGALRKRNHGPNRMALLGSQVNCILLHIARLDAEHSRPFIVAEIQHRLGLVDPGVPNHGRV